MRGRSKLSCIRATILAAKAWPPDGLGKQQVILLVVIWFNIHSSQLQCPEARLKNKMRNRSHNSLTNIS